MAQLIDSSHRPIRYLRISVTDRCNFRCIYCQPSEGIKLLNRDEILKYEEIISVARAAAELGITKIRLTGGEPLVRANLPELISELAKINGIDDISLTTNGMLLSQYAAELLKAGLKRVNISLDSLNPDKFEKITRTGKLNQVLAGIEVAKKVGLNPVKINVVAMRGINDDEILDFARLTMNDGWHIRFIELMPFGSENPPEEHNIGALAKSQQFLSVQEIKDKIGAKSFIIKNFNVCYQAVFEFLDLARIINSAVDKLFAEFIFCDIVRFKHDLIKPVKKLYLISIAYCI